MNYGYYFSFYTHLLRESIFPISSLNQQKLVQYVFIKDLFHYGLQ